MGGPRARKPRLAGDARVTDGGSWQEDRVYQLNILTRLNVLRARSEVHSVSPSNAVSQGRVSRGLAPPLVAITTAD
jgi:hypothetical protein